MIAEKHNEIVRHLPYLRRYARAILGSQERGDQYVRLCLEALLAEPNKLETSHDLKIQLFRHFHLVGMRIAEQVDCAKTTDSDANEYMQTKLLSLPSHERQALLLTALEGFSGAEVAHILSIGRDQAERLLMDAHDQLAAQSSANILIIEDELVIAFDIAAIVKEMGHNVVGTAPTKNEAVALAKAKRPDIVLADIQLGDNSSGIDAAREIMEIMDVPIIFVTAYPERLLTGERREPTYLVTKPFEPEALKVTIYQALLSHHTVKEIRAVG